MKRATRDWLKAVVVMGYTDAAQDALDSDATLRREVRRLKKRLAYWGKSDGSLWKEPFLASRRKVKR